MDFMNLMQPVGVGHAAKGYCMAINFENLHQH